MKLLLVSIIASIPLAAQYTPAAIVQIYREQVQPGRMAKVLQIEEAAARFCARMRCPNPYLALTSITGSSEVWWINGFDSFDAMEKVWQDYAANEPIMQQLDAVADQKADLVFPAVVELGRFRDDMSFASTPVSPRYFSITEIHLRPGHIAAFAQMRAGYKAALERVGRPQWVYQVTSGTGDDTFLVITPGHTVKESQSVPTPILSDALTGVIVSSTTRLFAVSPSLSLPAPSWQEADPDFWKRP